MLQRALLWRSSNNALKPFNQGMARGDLIKSMASKTCASSLDKRGESGDIGDIALIRMAERALIARKSTMARNN